jgi:ATP phosphoribosyltransferase
MVKTPIRLALPSKGALAEPTNTFLERCRFPIVRPNSRQYTGYLKDLDGVELLFQRVRDVAQQVSIGTAALGITGLDVVQELADPKICVVNDRLGYGHCRLVVAVPKSWVDVDTMLDLADVALEFRQKHERSIRIATTYPSLTRRFFLANNIRHFSIVQSEGAVEAAPAIGFADMVVDLTQSGSTLRENALKVIGKGTVLESQACLIANISVLEKLKDELRPIQYLFEGIDASLAGSGYRQISASFLVEDRETARSHLDNVLPNLHQIDLTLSPLYQSGAEIGYRAVFFLPSSHLMATIARLREQNAVNILLHSPEAVFGESSPTWEKLSTLLEQEKNC